ATRRVHALALHSFPTRRSSDLGTKKALPLLGDDPIITFNSDSVWVEEIGSNLANLMAAWNPERMDALLMIADATRTIGYVGRGRSEEHTSELQSRENLVCRLLL